MPKLHYYKLIRDRIPEIIEASGRVCMATPVEADEFVALLRDKLAEEANEARAADAGDLLTELADIEEIVDALLEVHGLSREELGAEQARRRAARGGFARRLKLLWTE